MQDLSHIQVPDEGTLNTMLARTKGQLFVMPGAGFLGSLLCDHDFVWDYDSEHGTASCNGKIIRIDPRFFVALSAPCRVSLLVHELWHTGYDHVSPDRYANRCPDYWNQAADYVINNRMELDGYDMSFGGLLEICLDHQYDNMTTEQVYDMLGPPPGGGGAPSPSGIPSKGMGQDIQPATPDQSAQIKNTIVKAIQSSRMAKEAGVIPGETTVLIDKFLNPILPWEVLLARFFNDISKDDYSWKRPSRRYEDEYLPSLEGDNRLEHLTYYLDVSGSITDHQLLRFNSEVKHIHETYNPKRLTLVTFDEEIQDTLEFFEDMPIEDIEIHGRGGTSLDPVYQHILKTHPTAAIIFSDLQCYPMGTDPRVPIVWVVTGNSQATVAFGQKIHIDRNA